MIDGWRPRAVAVGAAMLLLTGCGSTVGGSAQPGAAGESVARSASSPSSEGSGSTASTSRSGSSSQPAGPETTATAHSSSRTSAADASAADTSAADTSAAQTSGAQASDGTTATATPGPRWKLPDLKPNRPKTEYGDITAESGQAYGISFTGRDGKPAGELVYVVSKLTLQPGCASKAVKPVNGHFLQIDVKLEPRNVGSDAAKDWTGTFRGSAWTAYDATGTVEPGTDTDQAHSCAGARALPPVTSDLLRGGGLIQGSVVLDVKSPKGTVVLDVGADGGWEFRYG